MFVADGGYVLTAATSAPRVRIVSATGGPRYHIVITRLVCATASVEVDNHYLSNLPTGTANHLLEAAGVGAGILSGLASVALVKVEKDPQSGRALTKAGFPYAAVWTVALAARMLFAYGSTRWFHSALVQFSTTNHINPATYGTFFVLMVLTMISIRTISVIARAQRQGADLQVGKSRLARHLTHA
jgi:hypothetical protein